MNQSINQLIYPYTSRPSSIQLSLSHSTSTLHFPILLIFSSIFILHSGTLYYISFALISLTLTFTFSLYIPHPHFHVLTLYPSLLLSHSILLNLTFLLYISHCVTISYHSLSHAQFLLYAPDFDLPLPRSYTLALTCTLTLTHFHQDYFIIITTLSPL